MTQCTRLHEEVRSGYQARLTGTVALRFAAVAWSWTMQHNRNTQQER